jgi:hypothetical protein
MKRFTIISVALVMGLGGTAWAAPDRAWRWDLGVDTTSSVTQVYLAPDASVTFAPGVFGIGAGLKTYVGVPYMDVLVSPYLHGEIGVFYLNLGAVFEAKGPVSRSGKTAVSINDLDTPVSPLVALGFQPVIFRSESGVWKLDVGLEGFMSTVYVDEPDDPGEAVGLALLAPLTIALNVPKVTIGVTYAFGHVN